MKLDTYSAIWEILPYYGTLDKVFRLMRRLNNKTSEIWKNNMGVISKNVERKRVCFEYDVSEETKEILIQNPLIHTLHKFNFFVVDSKQKYKIMLDIIRNIENPHMFQAEIALSLSPERNTDVRLKNFEKYLNSNEFNFLSLYRNFIDKGIDWKLNIQNTVYSFASIEELPLLKDIKYISHIIFPWTQSRSVDNFIKIWKDVMDSKILKFNELILIWIDMESNEVSKLLSCFTQKEVTIFTNLKEKFNINELSELANSNDQIKIKININISNPYLIWSNKWRYESNIISLKKGSKLCNNIPSTNSVILQNWSFVYNNENFIRDFDQLWLKKSEIEKIRFDIKNNSQPIPTNQQNVLFVDEEKIGFSKNLINEKTNYLRLGIKDSKLIENEKLDLILKSNWVKVTSKYSNKLTIKSIKVYLSLV